MAYPSTLPEKLKYWFWRVYTPLHPSVRDIAMALGIVHHEGRQNFLVGVINPAHTPRELATFLVQQGFGNHFIAWRDDDELVSLRRTDGFRYQYHLRIYTDGEVRCHYEYTPEYRPIHHLKGVGFEDRSREFIALLKDWVQPAAGCESAPMSAYASGIVRG